ncbi:hypothetical protein [Streptomyces sp. NPDC048720]|uniref:hypothetical protein n=1 Tax=Streptomyces sp. NPDC048720 TaxID=3365588 RepID=UPI0037126FE9
MTEIQIARRLNSNERARIHNESLVFETFGDEEKLTIREVAERINQRAADLGDVTKRVSERTVRRAIDGLVQTGLIKPFAKTNNAQTYGKLSASFTGEDEKLVPHAGQLVSVENFVRTMTDPEIRPFTLKTSLMAERKQHAIRRMMVWAILSSVDAGYNDGLKSANEQLNNVIAELQFILQELSNFVDSPVWYDQYRERIARAVRKLQENDPGLFELATNYTRSE